MNDSPSKRSPKERALIEAARNAALTAQAEKRTGGPKDSAAGFLRALRQSNLLNDQDAKKVQALLGKGEPRDMARQLVEKNLLTPWQARMLLSGHHRFFLGRYKLLSQVGRGGMGQVFQAEQAPLGRIVALKMIRKELLRKPATVARFRREIQAAAALNHRHVVHAIDAEAVADVHFLVMEFVEGEDLSAFVKRQGPLSVGLACELIRQAAEGLQHAHEHGMVHRDIKPQNLLLSWHGEMPCVKVLDFGLARFTSERSEAGELTATGDIIGTPDYIAPEQAQKTKSADIRSDIYSLGLSLFYLLTGRTPFGGENAIEKIMARLREDVPLLSSERPEVPEALDFILAKMTHLDPNARYQTPHEVALALEPFSEILASADTSEFNTSVLAESQDSVTAAVAPTQVYSEEECARSLEVSGLNQFLQQLETQAALAPSSTEGTGGSGSGTVLGSLEQTRMQRQERERTQRRLVLSGVGLGILFLAIFSYWWKQGETKLVLDWPADERDGGTLEVDGRRQTVPPDGPLVFAGRPGHREAALMRAGYEPIEMQWSLSRGEEMTFRPEWKPTRETLRQEEWTRLEADVAAFRKVKGLDLERSLALAARIETYRRHWLDVKGVMEASGKLLSQLPVPADALRRDDIPEETKKIAGLGKPTALPELVGVLGDNRLRHWGNVNSVGFSSDGKTIASAGEDRSCQLWDAQTGRLIHWFEEEPLRLDHVVLSPDGRLAATFGHNGLELWETDTKKRRFWQSGSAHSAAFSPDGETLAVGRFLPPELAVFVVDCQTGEVRRKLIGHTKYVWAIEYSPDGKTLASASGDGTVRLWNVADGTLLQTLTHTDIVGHRAVKSLAFSPDGTLLASTSMSAGIKLWDPATGELRRTIETRAEYLVFSPDGKILVSSSSDSIELWNPTTGELLETLSAKKYYRDRGLAFSRDGKKLLIGCTDGQVQLLDAQTYELLIEQPAKLTTAAVSPDGRLLAVGDEAGGVTLHDLSTLKPVRSWSTGERKVGKLAFSPDGKTLASATLSQPAKLWDVATGELRIAFPSEHTGNTFSMTFMQDGTRLAVVPSTSRKASLLDTTTGELVRMVSQQNNCQELIGSPDGNTLFIGIGNDPSVIQSFDLTSGNETVFELAKEMNNSGQLAISPDGKLIAQGYGTRVNLWTVHMLQTRGKQRRGIEAWQRMANVGNLDDLSFSPDGSTLAVTTGDGQVGLWEVGKQPQPPRLPRQTTPKQVLQIGPPYARTWEVHYTPEGRHLITVNGNGTVYVLRLAEWSPES